jgi:hypothetical protein
VVFPALLWPEPRIEAKMGAAPSKDYIPVEVFEIWLKKRNITFPCKEGEDMDGNDQGSNPCMQLIKVRERLDL